MWRVLYHVHRPNGSRDWALATTKMLSFVIPIQQLGATKVGDLSEATYL